MTSRAGVWTPKRVLLVCCGVGALAIAAIAMMSVTYLVHRVHATSTTSPSYRYGVRLFDSGVAYKYDDSLNRDPRLMCHRAVRLAANAPRNLDENSAVAGCVDAWNGINS